MSYALDTNILARGIQKNHPMQAAANEAVEVLRLRNESLCILAQTIYEFWAVMTRPARNNGLGLSITESQVELARIKSLFRLFTDTPAIYPEWESLVVQHAVMGKNAHGARIVAAMKVHGISHLLTFNRDDFKRFQSVITVVEPKDLIQQQQNP